MTEFRSSYLAYLLFQLWETFVFLIAFTGGMIALEDAGLIRLTTYLDPEFFAILGIIAVFWNRLLQGLDLYASRRMTRRRTEMLRVLLAVALSAATLSLLGALVNQPMNQAPFLVWFMLIATMPLIAGRLVVRLALRTARAFGRNLRFVVIVSTGAALNAHRQFIADNPQMGFVIRAEFDFDQNDPGSQGELARVLMRERVDEVLIDLPLDLHGRTIADVLALCRRTGVSARLVSDVLLPGPFGPTIHQLGHHDCLLFNATPDWGWQGRLKRMFDLFGASMGLLTLAPLLLTVAILIRRDSAGPILFTQTRVGKDRRPFKLYKFRTMVADAEILQSNLEALNEAGGPVFKIRNDPRITRLGHFLRRYSIDELPQLLNVLKGDMSLVGPRPLPLRDVQLFEEDWYNRRFSVRPGLTCSWVLAGRSELEFNAWVQKDLEYIDSWSLGRDVVICLRTIPLVLRGSGAY